VEEAERNAKEGVAGKACSSSNLKFKHPRREREEVGHENLRVNKVEI